MRRALMFAILMFAVWAGTAAPVGAQGPDTGRNQIVTGGMGRVEVPPTQAIVTVGVQLQRPTAAEASQDAARVTEQILGRVTQAGIRRPDIRTSGVTLNPVFTTPRDAAPRITAYQATNTLTVTINELRLVGPVIDEAVRGGANTISGPSFGLRDPAEARREALTLAVREARDKAEAIARAAGLQIKGIERIVEEGVDVQVRMLERAVPTPAPGVPTPIEPGTVAVVARVTIVFTF
ncbi:MAG TPA: SIMPL domain-containing protein [bacterium]